jgi:Nuclease-related domain
MPAKVIRLRYAGTCVVCSVALPAGTSASWNAETRSTTCINCLPVADAEPLRSTSVERAKAHEHPDSAIALPTGEAGGSARREYERRRQRRAERIDERWGRLAGIVKFLSDDPQSITAWAKGSEGERRLAQHLLAAVGDRAVLLHDRKVPGTRGNIDHIAVAASGVWIIDAKHYKGLVTRRDVGGWFKTDNRLYVGKRDRTRNVDGLGWQIDAVRTALTGVHVPVTGVLCFIEADWKLLAKPFQINGVWVTWAKKLAEMIAAPGQLSPSGVNDVANRLATSLPPYVTTA